MLRFISLLLITVKAYSVCARVRGSNPAIERSLIFGKRKINWLYGNYLNEIFI